MSVYLYNTQHFSNKLDHLKFEIQNFVQFESGLSSFLCLTEDGKVYGRGDNFFGQLGMENDSFNEWTQIPINEKIVSISHRWNFSLFLSESGKVYGCGMNMGNLPLCQEEKSYSVVPAFDKKCKFVFAGISTSFFLTQDNELYISGLNQNHSTNHQPLYIKIPYCIEFFKSKPPIKRIEYQNYYMYILLENNELYRFNDKVENGIERLAKNVNIFFDCFGILCYECVFGTWNQIDFEGIYQIPTIQETKKLGPIRKIITNQNFCFLLTEHGRLYQSNLSKNDASSWKIIAKNISDIQEGYYFIFLFTKSKKPIFI